MKNISLMLLCWLVVMTGCRKDNDDVEITFNNRIDQRLTLSIYPTLQDYAKGTNATLRKTVNAKEVMRLPASTFTAGKTYYMDWFSDDYYYNNWFNDNYGQPGSQVAFTTNANGASLYFNDGLKGYSRKTFLSNNDLSSSWRAVDAYLSAGGVVNSFWSSMSANDQYRQVKIYKDFTAIYSYKDGAGNINSDTMSFKVHNSEDAYIEFFDNKGSSLGSMTSANLYGGAASSRDSITARFPNHGYIFTMIRD